MLYSLAIDPAFSPFLKSGATWGKKTRQSPHRGFTNDGEDVYVANRRTAEQKAQPLELMLGQIANYCPILSRNTIVKNSNSLDSIWQAIRLHFGFQTTGSHFLDFDNIRLLPDERPEDLFQRLVSFAEDSLLSSGCGITHHGEPPFDEDMTPSLENFIVLTWLRLLHPNLPKLVKQRYGTDLRARTLASIKPEISAALPSLLEELRDCASVLKTQTSQPFHNKQSELPKRTSHRGTTNKIVQSVVKPIEPTLTTF